MPDNNSHLSRREVLLAADDELPSNVAAKVYEHLSTCEQCRARVAELQTTIADFIRGHRQFHRDKVERPFPAAEVARARLEARLSETAEKSQPNVWTRLLRPQFGTHGLAYISLGLIVAAMGTWAVHRRIVQRESESAIATLQSAPIPDPSLTPGAVRSTAVKDVCAERPDEEWRAISISEQRTVFKEYGIANAQPENYELDYLITPELGGSQHIRNLWPEPHSSTVWNSYVKDDLEDHLHKLVCQGKLNLATAQHDIATDWISAYKKYFHTDRPIPNHSDQDSDDPRGPNA